MRRRQIISVIIVFIMLSIVACSKQEQGSEETKAEVEKEDRSDRFQYVHTEHDETANPQQLDNKEVRYSFPNYWQETFLTPPVEPELLNEEAKLEAHSKECFESLVRNTRFHNLTNLTVYVLGEDYLEFYRGKLLPAEMSARDYYKVAAVAKLLVEGSEEQPSLSGKDFTFDEVAYLAEHYQEWGFKDAEAFAKYVKENELSELVLGEAHYRRALVDISEYVRAVTPKFALRINAQAVTLPINYDTLLEILEITPEDIGELQEKALPLPENRELALTLYSLEKSEEVPLEWQYVRAISTTITTPPAGEESKLPYLNGLTVGNSLTDFSTAFGEPELMEAQSMDGKTKVCRWRDKHFVLEGTFVEDECILFTYTLKLSE